MSDEVTKSDEPHDRLTRLTTRFSDIVENDPEFEGVKAIFFLEDEHKAGIQSLGYDSEVDALASLLMHIRAMFRAAGKDFDVVAVSVPDSPAGL